MMSGGPKNENYLREISNTITVPMKEGVQNLKGFQDVISAGPPRRPYAKHITIKIRIGSEE